MNALKLVSLLALPMASAFANAEVVIKDKEYADAAGIEYLERTVVLDKGESSERSVAIKLLKLSNGSYLYDTDIQSTDALEYNDELCQDAGRTAPPRHRSVKTIIGGPGAIPAACISPKLSHERLKPVDRPGALDDR